jgi:cell division protein FtsB
MRLRSVMPTMIMGALCLYFSFYLLFGPRGYLALQRIQETSAIKAVENQELVNRRQSLESDVKLMRPNSLDADMAEEQARKTLGYVKPNEIVINLK